MKEYEVVVVGAGPGGYQTALELGSSGIDTLLIDRSKENIGGVCLNVGCIPTKNYLESANYISKIPFFKSLGVQLDYNGFNIKQLQEKTRELINEIRSGVVCKLDQAGVKLAYGEASFLDANKIEISGETIAFKKCVIATGSKVREFENIELDSKHILSSSDMFELDKLPKSIAIIGTGAIGCEFATFFNSVGVDVTLIGRGKRLLSKEDEDVSKALLRVFKRSGIDVINSVNIERVNKTEDGVEVLLDKEEQSVTCEVVLVASGRVPNVDTLNLLNVGVKLDAKGYIDVDNSFVTSIDSIYALGDCVDTPAYAHTAYKEGHIVAKNIINSSSESNLHISPSTIFTTPQVASCGLNELAAKEQGLDVEVKKAYYKVNAKAKIQGDDSGFAKVVIDSNTKVILGASIIGEGACEIIHELVFSVEKKLTIDELRDVIHAHPTLSEIITYL